MVKRKNLLFLLVLNRSCTKEKKYSCKASAIWMSEKANNNIVYDWYFISENSDTEISQKEFKGIKNPTFTAPYVDFRPDKEDDQNVKDKNIRTEKNIRHSLDLLSN